MGVLKIILNALIPFIIIFLVFSTFMGYIAENIRDYYNFKWLALAFILGGYILQYYKWIFGLTVVVLSIYIWFLF
ncbi:hypothetical protein QO000_002062 [Alkalihalobacillus hemicentroti]|uniref:Uncharacterized protein n=1 Tax=Guptibacillus hwajinpoensis TaxID=208199 RepID=A0ABU0K163_9BACL|nr:hypothetical protein [Alkalihalobacillus hemicentroti]